MSGSFKIVPAKISDLDSILNLEELCFTSDRFSRRQFRYLLLKAQSSFFVVKELDRVVASLILLRRANSSKLRIYSIAVHPDSRGKGLAQSLLDKAVSYAEETGCRQIHLEVRQDNLPAIKLYEKDGFSKTGVISNFYSDGSDAIIMVKKI